MDELIEQTQERFQVTSIVISHDMASVFKIADRIVYLYKGRIEESDVPPAFVQSKNPAVREFLEASGVGVATTL